MSDNYGTPTSKLMEINLNTYARTDITLEAASVPVATAFREYHELDIFLPLTLR